MRINQFSNALDAAMGNTGFRDVLLKTVDEDGFVRDIVGITFDQESDCVVVRLEIQKKNGELE